jgi:hypothetical protein
MFRPIQPISDLQRVQRFDDYDLAANRAGELSTRQHWRYLAARLGEHLLGALIVLFFVALFVNWFGLAPSLDLIGALIAVALLAALVLFALRTYPTIKNGVKAISGPLEKHEIAPLGGLPLDEISIGPTRFFVRPEVWMVLDDSAPYKAYYLERSARAGGCVLLSIESTG